MTAPHPLPRRSILRRSIAAVLVIELLAAGLLLAATAFHEQHLRVHAFDQMLQGRANTLLGAVGDADDPGDNVVLDRDGLALPTQALFQVQEDGKALLGRSSEWPASLTPERSRESGISTAELNGRPYRFLTLHGVRVVDPGESGGTTHHITVIYGESTRHLHAEVMEAVRYYAAMFAGVLLFTAIFLTLFLRHALLPLEALAVAASVISSRQWRFAPPNSARETRELAPLTRAIDAALHRLQLSFDQQRRLTSDAAHELKTDVAIIKSSLQLLMLRRRSVQEYEQGLENCMMDCDRLERTVQQMLTLARVEYVSSASSEGKLPEIDLAVHAASITQTLLPMAALRGQTVVCTASGTCLVAVHARDADLLCVNLLRNALQHSLPGGEVTVRVEGTGSLVTLTVEDQGSGIPEHVLPHIFEPFFMADEARDRKRGGTGLGLAISRSICDAAQGEIFVTSNVGVGTRVCVRFPARAASETAEAPMAETASLGSSPGAGQGPLS